MPKGSEHYDVPLIQQPAITALGPAHDQNLDRLLRIVRNCSRLNGFWTISTLTEMLALRELMDYRSALSTVCAVGTLPACTMRKGSVQKTRLRASASRDAFTAIDSSMGSSGGMTEVMIMVQFKNSLKRSLSGSCRKRT